jgi:hypothetical protein
MCRNSIVVVGFFVCLCTAGAAGMELKVDIGATGQVVKAGWTEWSEPRLDPGPPSAQKTFGDVTVTLTQTGGNGLAFRNGTGGELTGELVCVDNQAGPSASIIVTISGLVPDDYVITTYHNYIFEKAAVMDITVNGELKVAGLTATVQAPNDEIAASATYEFSASGDVVIEIASNNSANVPLNGFHILRKLPKIEFAADASGDFEDVSPAQVTVVLSDAEPGQTYSVDYAATGGTATPDVDYHLLGAGPACWDYPTQCHGDCDNDANVKGSDFLALKNSWYACDPDANYNPCADFDRDGCVKGSDFLTLKSNWYQTVEANCPPAGGGGNTLTFNPGETGKTIDIDIVNDGLYEGDETIMLELLNPAGPNVSLGGIAQHTYTIVESEPSVAFETSTGAGSESTTPVAIPVSLSHLWSDTVTVQYSVAGTATGGGVDYTLTGGGVLQFDPGQVTKYINIDIVDDAETESAETIVLTLFNPTNASLGATAEHTYTIFDNEQGTAWDGLAWYYSETNGGPFVNAQGQFEWDPEQGGQYVTRLPEQRLSQVGDVAQVSYYWLTDGAHSCPDCEACPDGCYDDDITCIAGTSDLRAGLFEADGEYIEQDGYDVKNSIFEGYKGYNWRFGPNMKAGPTRWVDCTDEVHKTGQFAKKPQGSTNLMTTNDGLMEALPGFELPPGEWSLWTISLRRTGSGSVEMSITLNGRTYTYTDGDGSEQPQKIDVFGIHMRNARPYDRLVLDTIP